MRGKVVVLNLWATWCAPCVREMPALDRLQALVGGPDAEIVALSLDRGGMAQVGPFFERLGLANLAIYLDPPSEAMKTFRPRGLPTTIIVGRDGRELGRVEGELAWDGEPGQTIVRDARAAGG
jgi:thiol-disulfide isomerase/thioredoxin